MKNIKIFDVAFAQEADNTFMGLRKPEFQTLCWNRDAGFNSGTCVFTDTHITKGTAKSIDCKTKIALVLEPRAIRSDVVEYLLKNPEEYDYIFTHDEELLSKHFHAYPCPAILHFVTDWSRVRKTKLVSMIASGKSRAPGHKLRQKIMPLIKGKVDLFGKQIRPIDKKEEGLQKYMFSIAIENSRNGCYFTEKILDCFTTRTVPIYWGCPDIGDYFDMNGIITFDTLEELQSIIDNLSEDKYNKMKKAIEYNYVAATDNYRSIETFLDWHFGEFFEE